MGPRGSLPKAPVGTEMKGRAALVLAPAEPAAGAEPGEDTVATMGFEEALEGPFEV